MQGIKPKNKVLVIVGPSGVGKDTLMEQIVNKYPNLFHKGVTHTTRQMRPGEQEGKNYYYVSKGEFEAMKNNNEFVETNYYNNNYYGSSIKEYMNGTTMDKIMYFIIDINGANAVNKLAIPANFIAILPYDMDTLYKRLTHRGEDPERIKGRIATAHNEIEEIRETKYFSYKIINGDLRIATYELEQDLKLLYPNFFK